MLRIKTYIAHSPISGLGLFSGVYIPKGGLIWSFEAQLDRCFTEAQFSNLPDEIRIYLEEYSYRSVLDNLIYCPFDNDKYMNHSTSANTLFAADGNFYAARDIAPDEEITCNYKQFNANWEQYAHIYEDKKRVLFSRG